MNTGNSFERTMAYFNRPGFKRMLSAIWKKYASLERVGGQAVIQHASAEECEAINLFFGWNHKPGQSISVPLELFEQELAGSPFPNTLVQLHAVLTGKPLFTKTEKQLLLEREWLALFTVAERSRSDREPLHPNALRWLKQLKRGEGQGYRTLLEQFKLDPLAASLALDIAASTLHVVYSETNTFMIGTIPLPTIRLPILAAQVCGDSHALDLTQPAGRLLLYALREQLEGDQATPHIENSTETDHDITYDTLKVRDIYRSAGIADDDLSSLVYTYTPIYGAAAQPAVWTLRQVENMINAPECSSVYTVENPAVFSALLDISSKWMGEQGSFIKKNRAAPMLICTSGPASAAALRFLQRIFERPAGDCKLYYSGDFDVKGLGMGLVLFNRFKEHFMGWRFDQHTYLRGVDALPGPAFDRTDALKLVRLSAPWAPQLNAVMAKRGCKLYQESVIDLLAMDWIRALNGQVHPGPSSQPPAP